MVGLLPRLVEAELDRRAVALGEMLEHVALLVPDAALDGDLVAEHLADRFAQRFGAIDHEQQALLNIQPAGHQIGQQCAGDGGVLGAAGPQPERELLALGRDPQRDDIRAALDLDPIEHHHREAQIGQLPGHQMPQRLAGALHERTRDRRFRRRPLPRRGLLTDRLLAAAVLPGRDTGEDPLEREAAELVAIGEMLIGLKRDLRLAIGRADPRAPDRNPSAAERHLPVLVAVTHRGTARVVLALRAHDLRDLHVQQLAQHAEPDLDRQRQQPFLRCPDQLPQSVLHALREHGLIVDRLGDRYVALHGGSSFDLGRSPATLPPGADGPEGPPSPQSSTSPGTTSQPAQALATTALTRQMTPKVSEDLHRDLRPGQSFTDTSCRQRDPEAICWHRATIAPRYSPSESAKCRRDSPRVRRHRGKALKTAPDRAFPAVA